MNPYPIVIADDHALFRQGLRRILEEMPGIVVIGEAKCGLELLDLLRKLSPQMVILDISMPNLRGLEAIHGIKAGHPDVKVLILTMHKDKEYLYQTLSEGADGYLLKEDADAELYAAIDKIRKGKIYVSPFLSDAFAEELANRRIKDFRTLGEGDTLTAREREILKLIAEGKSNKEIGDLLFISARTVERHRANIMDKLKLKNTAELVKYAIQKGYV
jgi:DNA-binding NarL/FixJ family response regulator